VAVGLAAALALARFMAAIVFGIESRDPATLAIVPLVLLVVAGGAAIIPATSGPIRSGGRAARRTAPPYH
jgi:hypothetical protein